MTQTNVDYVDPVARLRGFAGKRLRVYKSPTTFMPVGTEVTIRAARPEDHRGPGPKAEWVVQSHDSGTLSMAIFERDAARWDFEALPEVTFEFGLPFGSEVLVKTSLRHRDLIGKRGTLEPPPAGSQLAARIRIGADIWPIDRAQDWELVAAPLGMPCGKETFLWGEELHVKRCLDHPTLQGLTGMLAEPPEGSELAGLFWVGADRYEVSRGSRWQFERPGILQDAAIDAELTAAELAAGVDTSEPRRRSREIYDHMAFTLDLDAAVKEIRDLLVEKNQAYGNSALDPVRIFSKADPMEQLFVRIDDKLSRLKRGHAAGEDVVKDLQGYLLLVRVAQMRAERNKT